MSMEYEELLELGIFSDGSYVVKKHKTITKEDVLLTASLDDRLNKNISDLVIKEDYCRYVKCDEFNSYDFGEYYYRLGYKKGRGAIPVWVVTVKQELEEVSK